MKSFVGGLMVVVAGLSLGGCVLTDRNFDTNFTSSHLPYTDQDGRLAIPQIILANTCSALYAPPAPLGEQELKVVPTATEKGGAIDTRNDTLLSGVAHCVKRTEYSEGSYSDRYNAAAAAFTALYGNSSSGILARNRVLDAIMQAADKTCGDFKVALARANSAEETTVGLLGALTGSLGGLLTSADAARSLSASAGLITGSGAVIDKALFKNESLKVIYSGLDMKRQELAAEFDGKRTKPLSEYSLDTAVKDGFRYVDACNVIEALSKVSDEIAKGGGAKVPESQEAQTVKAIDALTAQQMQTMLSHDPAKPVKLPKDPPAASDAVLQEYKTAYKTNLLAGKPGRLAQLQALLTWAQGASK